MKKKTIISNIVISIIVFSLIAICSLAYAFYKYSNNGVIVTKVKSDDYFSIDSIKSKSVDDTVRYYNSRLREYQIDEIKKDSIINTLTVDIKNLKKIYDSLVYKSNYLRQRLREVKLTTDTVQ